MLVTCGGCAIKFDRHSEPSEFISGKWYHERCAQIKKERNELTKYICQLFKLKTVGPMNNILIKKYKEKNGYTYAGMLKTLKYFYEVKKGDKDNSEERIGIIPFVYDEARKYYENQKYWQEQQANKIANQKPVKEMTVNILNKEKPKNTEELFDLNSLEGVD